MTAFRSHFADVYFRIKVGGEGVAVIAAIHVYNIQFPDFIEMMFGQPGCEHIGCTGIESGPQQGHQPGLAELFLVRPLPFIFEFGRVPGLIVGGIQIVHAALQTGVHDGQVLIGQRDVDHQVRLFGGYQCRQFGDVVRIHLCCFD